MCDLTLHLLNNAVAKEFTNFDLNVPPGAKFASQDLFLWPRKAKKKKEIKKSKICKNGPSNVRFIPVAHLIRFTHKAAPFCSTLISAG